VLVVLALVIAFSDWLPRPEQAVLSQTDAPPTPSSVPTPVAAISVPAPCAPSGVDLTFDGTGSTDTTDYAWDFGDTATSMSAVATHAFGVDGTYLVTLVVVGPGGTDSESVSIAVPCP
jgi:PKD repeat protein